MEFLMKLYAYLAANWQGILLALGMVITTMETIVRLTPTKTDDGFVARIAKVVDALFTWLKVPNRLKK